MSHFGSTKILGDLRVTGLTDLKDLSLDNLNVRNQLISLLANGTAPFSVISSTRVANLNVDRAGYADLITTSQKSDSVNYQLPFVSSITASNQSLFTDNAANITYNPSTNTLTVPNISATNITGAISGSATSLATTRTLWGQNFNGTANVIGDLISVGNITMGTNTNKATITYSTNIARTYTIPDAGKNANFVLTEGNQTINGTKIFSDLIVGDSSAANWEMDGTLASIFFLKDSSEIPRLTVNNQGDVAIGTSDPAGYRLKVEGSAHITGSTKLGMYVIPNSLSYYGSDVVESQTLNIAAAATYSGRTKTVNIGLGAEAGSTTNINIGSSNGGSTTINSPQTNMNGNVLVSGNLQVIGTTITNNVEMVATSNGIVFEGTVVDDFELTLLAGALTADRTVTLKDRSGTILLAEDLQDYTINPKFGSIIGMGNDSGVLFFNDNNNETLANYWTSKDGFEIRGDSNLIASVVLKTGNLYLSQNGYITGNLGINGNLKFENANLRNALDLNNNKIVNVDALTFADSGPDGYIQMGSWSIWNSPNDLTTNSDGNFQFVTGGVRKATINTAGQLELPVATGTAPLVVESTTKVSKLNADLLDGYDGSNFLYSKEYYAQNYITLGYGTGGVGHWHKLVDITVVSAYTDYMISFDWVTRYSRGKATMHVHSDNDLLPDIYSAMVTYDTDNMQKSNSHFKYVITGSVVSVWIFTPGWETFKYFRKDIVTEAAPNYVWYDSTTGAHETTGPSGPIFSTQTGTDAYRLQGYAASNFLLKTGGTMSGNIIYDNYGLGVIGSYSPQRFQNVFAMGPLYTMKSDGTSLTNDAGNDTFYGIAWTHNANTDVNAQKMTGHHAIFVTGGVTKSAIGDHIWTGGNITGSDITARSQIYLTAQGAGVYMKDETTATQWHVHMHGDRLRLYNGVTEQVLLSAGDVYNTITDISITHNATTVVVNSSDGTDGTINGATTTAAGVVTNAAQEWAGTKTFRNGVTVKDGANTGSIRLEYNSTTKSLDFIFA